uniref:Uncharacterized protein n=1 Tax=Lygus hesperus TaxID=30085 RepID=A0A0K8THL4_LYGHE
MLVYGKVNDLNSEQYPSSLRRFVTEGKDETSAAIFTSEKHGWVTNGDELSIVDTAKGCPRLVYFLGEDVKDSVDITCIEELVLNCTTPTPLLFVRTSLLYNSQLKRFQSCTIQSDSSY